MTAARCVLRADGRFPMHFLRSSWKSHIHGNRLIPLRYADSHVRHMGIFQEFSKRLKGEVDKNPELQKSIQELREKSGDLKSRTKEVAERIYKHVGEVRKEAGATARMVSSIFKEKVHEVKDRVNETTSQAKESANSGSSTEEKVEEMPGRSSSDAASSSTDTNEAFQSETLPRKDSFLHKFSSGLKSFSSSATAVLDKVKRTKLVDLAQKGYGVLKAELTTTSSQRARDKAKAKYSAASAAPRSSSTAVVPVIRKKTTWERGWDFFKVKAESNRVYKRFKGVKKHPIVVKGQELAEDLRERWETSDSPMVHKIQDLNESLFGETGTAMALKEIRKRDPTFSFPDFLAEVQENVRDVLQAYLKGDIKELQKWCSREVIDRCRAERRAYESQGIFFDNKILHVSDIELKETKLMGNIPIIIITFQTQQIFCVRDKHGKITQGAKDDILTVYYAWAMQQVSPEEMEADEMFPQWQLREMQQLGIQAII